jgi:hypothetical protein
MVLVVDMTEINGQNDHALLREHRGGVVRGARTLHRG